MSPNVTPRRVQWLSYALFLGCWLIACFPKQLHAQCTLGCANNVQISVSPLPVGACQSIITAEMILTGYQNALATCAGGNPNNFQITIMSGPSVLVQGNGSVFLNGNTHVGRTYVTKVSVGGNECWGSIKIEDKVGPTIACMNHTVTCAQNVNPAWPPGHPNFATRGDVPLPTAVDNCTATSLILVDNLVIDNDFCDMNGTKEIIRSWIAVDAYGNQSTACAQSITVTRSTIDFPKDITWTCSQYAAYNGIVSPHRLHPFIGDANPATANIIEVNLNPACDDANDIATINSTNLSNGGTGCPGAGLDDKDVLILSGGTNFGSGMPAFAISACNYTVSESTVTMSTCGNSFQMIRTWAVMDWCSNTILTVSNGNDNIQIIKVVDETAPVVVAATFNLSANVRAAHPQPCRSTGIIPAPSVTDNCNSVNLRVFVFADSNCDQIADGLNIGEGQAVLQGGIVIGYRIPNPGIPLGCYVVEYQATDACGNVNPFYVPFRVIDDIVPTVVCDQITKVTLTNDGTAVVDAIVFDDGSYDNCCLDGFRVRRMAAGCNAGTAFGATTTFCCEDIGNPVQVVMEVRDCFGNTNTCMVEVLVEDKTAPTCVAPAPRSLDCDAYFSTYESIAVTNHAAWDAAFGAATFNDNCATNVVRLVTKNIDNCGRGTITRRWTVTDNNPTNASSVCVQTISFGHVSNWSVEFPDDRNIVCTNTTSFNINDPSTSGVPKIFFETCELIGTTYEDRIYTSVPGACYKVERTWTVINWCVYDANVGNTVVESSETAIVTGRADINGDFSIFSYDAAQDLHPIGNDLGDGISGTVDDHTPETNNIVPNDSRTFQDGLNVSNWSRTLALKGARPDGYITYKQVIKITDNTAPIITNCGNRTVGDSLSSTCGPYFANLAITVMDACSDQFTITWEIDLTNNGTIDQIGTGSASGNYPIGSHRVDYKVKDRCGNQSSCSFVFNVVDLKKPTPYCLNGLNVEIMQTGMVNVSAWMFNNSSFDNCTGPLKFSFSSNVADSVRTMNCDSVANSPIAIEFWVTDIAGNQDFCTTMLDVQDNMNVCGGPITTPRYAVGGGLGTEMNRMVSNAQVALSGQASMAQTTDVTGNFNFANVPGGGDYTITPMKDDMPLNGITTFDLVLMSRHILGLQTLDSPYKIIAADVNNSRTVTTADMVELRRLILLMSPSFMSNTSWRFVPKAYVFPNPSNPFVPGAGFTHNQPFPEVINFNNLSQQQLNADFVAVKIGDMNSSVVTNFSTLGDRTFDGTLAMNTTTATLEKGQLIAVPVTADMTDIIGAQFTMHWDDQTLQVRNIEAGLLSEEHIGTAFMQEGDLTASWNGQASGNQVLFTLWVEASANIATQKAFTFTSTKTLAEGYNQEGQMLQIQWNQQAASFGKMELYQNQPNPFAETTKIGFEMPASGKVILSIVDAAGRQWVQQSMVANQGYNAFQIDRVQLKAAGILRYTIVSDFGALTKTMLVLD